jgi:cytochrome c
MLALTLIAGTIMSGAASAAGPIASPAARNAFQVCSGCHADTPGTRRMGPALFGIMGRQAGVDPGFLYSPAMKAAKLRWDPATLDAFLKAPRTVVPGTRMPFPGTTEPTKRALIIEYLGSLSR